jgi:hypothetical protein
MNHMLPAGQHVVHTSLLFTEVVPIPASPGRSRFSVAV